MAATKFKIYSLLVVKNEADVIAADNVTQAFAASGHVHVTHGAMKLRSERVTRDAEEVFRLDAPTTVTTCSNAVGHTHWNLTGAVEFRDKDYVLVRNAWLRFYEIPVFWFPYLYYPTDWSCGFSWMPGYIGRWGGYLLTKYKYHLIGDAYHRDNTWWLKGDTRFDLRWEQGVAFGEDLGWNLGDFGRGDFQFYYAWDQDAEDRYGAPSSSGWNSQNWGSGVEKERYGIALNHRWEASERDNVWVRGSYYSDSYFRNDFFRKTMFDLNGQWIGEENSGVFWEHLEDPYALGAEVSGRLNKFFGMTGRLPEVYFDVNPRPLFGSSVIYETENRLGYLTRNPAEYGTGTKTAFSYNPGIWADYSAARFDTYHRLSRPFKTFSDVLSIVPRFGYRGTYWSETGATDLTGQNPASEDGSAFRSVFEAGSTFAARGTAWVNDQWQHMMEPYLDVLVQQAAFAGLGSNSRPYIFDSLDASSTWEDQFAGRSRNLPYSYYGMTPGWRNAWDKMDDRGNLRKVLDLDVYTAFQFGSTSFDGDSDGHKLAEAGKPNYGKNGYMMVPGARLRWTPVEDLSLGTRAEYDSDNSRIAYANAELQHRLCTDFSYKIGYALRDFRYWDYSSSPYDSTAMAADEYDFARIHNINAAWEHKICSWLAWGPQVRWDLRSNELDSIGAWIDYMTDCLGFRFIVEYDAEYQTIDGYQHEKEWSVGFYIYLRCFGADSGNPFLN